MLILSENPCIGKWWSAQEVKYHVMPDGHVRKDDQYFHHNNRSTAQLMDMVNGDLFYSIVNAPATQRVDYELTCTCGVGGIE
jgi:hypothetical protein